MILTLTSEVKSSRKLLAGALRIYARHMTPGSRFPSENELIREQKIARMTLRRAMDDLVTEGTLYRKWGSGTFVAQNDPRSVYFVLPTLGIRKSESFRIAMKDFYDAFCRKAEEIDVKVVNLVASLTNRRDELDWEVFQFLPDGAKVILPGYWYNGLFDLLRKKKCKVVFVAKQASFDFLYEKQIADWFRIEYDLRAAVELAMDELRRCNVKRAVLIDDDNHFLSPYQAGLRQALKEKYIPELVIYGNKENDFGGNVLINMLKSVDRYPFEGIIAASRSIAIKVQDVLNAMKLEMPLILLKDGKRGDKISSITFPDNIVAGLALDQLTAQDHIPGIKTIKPLFYEAESTRKFLIQP